MNVRTNLLLPKDLVKEVDHFAGPRGRSRYVTEALEAKLRRDRQLAAFESTFGALVAEDYPHWSTPEITQDWVRARRREVTDAGTGEAHVSDPRLDVPDRPHEGRSRRSRTMAPDIRAG